MSDPDEFRWTVMAVGGAFVALFIGIGWFIESLMRKDCGDE